MIVALEKGLFWPSSNFQSLIFLALLASSTINGRAMMEKMGQSHDGKNGTENKRHTIPVTLISFHACVLDASCVLSRSVLFQSWIRKVGATVGNTNEQTVTVQNQKTAYCSPLQTHWGGAAIKQANSLADFQLESHHLKNKRLRRIQIDWRCWFAVFFDHHACHFSTPCSHRWWFHRRGNPCQKQLLNTTVKIGTNMSASHYNL